MVEKAANGQTATGDFGVLVSHTADRALKLDFGRNVSWVKMSPDQALALAALLEQFAMEAKIGI